MKRMFFIGLTFTVLLFSLAGPVRAVDITAVGKLQLEHIAAVEGFAFTGGTFDLCLNDYVSVSTGVGLTPAGTGWLIGGKIFPTGWDSEIRPLFSLYYGTVGTAGKGDTEELVLITGEAVSIGLEWCPWIALFERIEEGELPDSVSSFQLFTYYIEVSYPFYRIPPGCRDDSAGLRVTLGIGVYFD